MSTPINVETRGNAIIGTAIALPIIASMFVGARIYTRVHVINFFGIDDWCALATLAVSIAYSVCLGIWTTHGGGMHMADMTEEIEVEYYKWIMIASEFYALALLGYKSAILLLYVRIFSVNHKFKIACYCVMAFNAAYLLSNIILQIFSCMPVEKYFDKKISGHCVSLIPPDIAWGAMSMVSDFAIALLPVPVIWRLNLNRREKILVSLVFLSGLVAFVMATTRWIIATIDLTAEDRTWIAGLAFLFSIVEVNTGIICGCTPTLKPLFRFAREHTSKRRSSTGGRYGRKHRFHHNDIQITSVSDDATHLQKPKAPPGTFNRSTTEKSGLSDHSIPSPASHTQSQMSMATTARPSLVEALPQESAFSQDILHLPREGTREQPMLHDNRDVHEMV